MAIKSWMDYTKGREICDGGFVNPTYKYGKDNLVFGFV